MAAGEHKPFSIDREPFLAALARLEEIGARQPDAVRQFALAISFTEDLALLRATRAGLAVEPSPVLRGFLLAFPPEDDSAEKLMGFVSEGQTP